MKQLSVHLVPNSDVHKELEHYSSRERPKMAKVDLDGIPF